MYKKAAKEFYKELECQLTDKEFLGSLGLSKKAMLAMLEKEKWREQICKIFQHEEISCVQVLQICQGVLNRISDTPEGGWLCYIYEDIVGTLFPEKALQNGSQCQQAGKLFYLTVLRCFLEYERQTRPFSPLLHMEGISEQEIRHCSARGEYLRYLQLCQQQFLYEFMRIGMEITPFRLLSHVAGVHFVALHVGRQLVKAGAPVDLALVSGAAACHDVGKFGCKDHENTRVPYLHYYYTDQCLGRFGMPVIGHIAANHSTWDLELENLSVESLILIYADFRVRGSRNKEGIEEFLFYTLEEAFQVILSKLDNVDETKRQRYIRVYSKLKDFENYMMSVGVHTGLDSNVMEPPIEKDAAIMTPEETVSRLKELAIEHNIHVMNMFNSEAKFGTLLEEARSENQWKNIRAYLNIFEEYSTYLTQKQKMMTLNFLYELLMHREGDIRRQAAGIMGKMIALCDEDYRKELPEHVIRPAVSIGSRELWQKYVYAILFPDHKVTEQHKRWIGYTFRIVLGSLLESCDKEERHDYISDLLAYYQKTKMDDTTAFGLLDSMPFILPELREAKEISILMDFALRLVAWDSLEIKIGALRFAERLCAYEELFPAGEVCQFIKQVFGNIRDDISGILYLKLKILEQIEKDSNLYVQLFEKLQVKKDSISEIFLENLKVDTPWILKIVNIEFLLQMGEQKNKSTLLHIATHLSNLIKVSERVIVRHCAGEGLVKIIRRLPLDERNEIAIELAKGLEIGEYQVSKYIPAYLGEIALYLHPNELNSLIQDLKKLQESVNDRISSVALNTLGFLVQNYPAYENRFYEEKEVFESRRNLILGMILRGLSSYREVVSQEAFLVLGNLFASQALKQEQKYEIFEIVYKKMLTLISERKETKLSAFNNAAALNNMYRFVSDYLLTHDQLVVERKKRIVYFPGTFDPFSLSHKAIALAARDLGFEVYLALDEFSWSKKTQPRMIRRQIMTMSIAGEQDIYVFPDEIPINIANPQDIKHLEELFPDASLYIAVGSDVIANASSYKRKSSEHSIHHLNHLIFRRASEVEGLRPGNNLGKLCECITGDVIKLTLPIHLEDVSSTRIRENIDLNRDISNLIDPVVQNFIYDNSLYLREPLYKHVIQSKNIQIASGMGISPYVINEIVMGLVPDGGNLQLIKQELQSDDLHCVTIRDDFRENKLAACGVYREISSAGLYKELQHLDLSAYIRERVFGRIAVITGIFFDGASSLRQPIQMVLTELLAECLEKGITCAIYRNADDKPVHPGIVTALKRQGFQEIDFPGSPRTIFVADMRFPICVLKNIGANLKEPFARTEKVLDVMDNAHKHLQRALAQLHPGNLVLSIDIDLLHRKLIRMIAKENNVPLEPFCQRQVGPYMCVPFGAMLRGMVIPNTVTKTLHTEKVFNSGISSFGIQEFPFYSTIANQARTIKSFGKPVILVDDFLHKGYRIKKLDPVLKQENIEVSKIVVGILSGRGKDLMEIQNRNVESAYFIPNLRLWFVESSLYPFIGGDSVAKENVTTAGIIPSINLILPYVAPRFLTDVRQKAVYDLSMTCLKNTRSILKALEEEYQAVYERTLTLNRLSEAITAPRMPDRGNCVSYDMNLPPSVAVDNDIEMLLRMKSLFESI